MVISASTTSSCSFSGIIAAVLYHPPDADNKSMREYLRSSLEIVESKFPSHAFIFAGDFNKLDFKSTAKTFQLKPSITFPTRGNNTLDQILPTFPTFICRQ